MLCRMVMLTLNAERNKHLIVELNGLELLVNLLQSSNTEVQCNACGCVTNLATLGNLGKKNFSFLRSIFICCTNCLDENKIKVANSGILPRLIRLASSDDIRVQRNATGALLNLTHAGTVLPFFLIYFLVVLNPHLSFRWQIGIDLCSCSMAPCP